MSSYIKITRAINGRSRSAKITFAAKKGQLVTEDAATISTGSAPVVGNGNVFAPGVAWKLADGTKGVHLERDVIQAPIPLASFIYDTQIELPDVMGDNGDGSFTGYSSGRMVEEVELEGPDLIDSSITAATAANTPVSTKAGKISTVAAAASPKEVYGYIRAQLVPVESGNVRVLVEVVQ